MRIAKLELTPIALPFRETYRTASGELEDRSMIVARLRASSGEVGLGEAVPLSLRGGPDLAQVERELAHCGSLLEGVDAAPAAGGERDAIRGWISSLLDRCRGAGAGAQAVAAIDTALHDLAGQAGDQPVWRLLGARRSTEVRCNATLDASRPDEAARLAAGQLADGFTTYKIKVGTGDDLGRVAAVRQVVGPEAEIRIDANCAWGVDQALEMLARLEDQGLELVEQPCATLAGLAEVRAQTSIPVVADESVSSAEDASAALAAEACDAATLKLAKVGGSLAALRIAERLPSYLSSALDGPIGIAAAIHTCQALPAAGAAAGFAHGLATLGMFSATYASTDGLLAARVSPPESAGLGIEVDEAALEELRIG